MDPSSEPNTTITKKIPTIAIVGRPNVGKSTLFNRLIGKRHAVVANEAGTTRDRIAHHFRCNGLYTLLVDTGGLEHGDQENIEADIQTQAQIAIEDADLILFLTDVSQELTVDDFAAVDILRRTDKPVMLIANKADNIQLEDQAYNLFELGFGEPIKISAIHKHGIEELTSRIEKELKNLGFKGDNAPSIDQSVTHICILGKPNAGKSSLVNAILNEEKVIVSEIEGTTRDATDTLFTYKDVEYNLIDTAGLKRPGKTKRGVEKFSSLRGIQAAERSDIVVLLIDGHKGITAQDCHIAEHALEHQKGLIITINKIDLLESGEEMRNKIISKLRRRFAFVPWAPILFISAKNKKNTYQIFELAQKIIHERKKRIKTAEFNTFLQKITQKHLPASRKIRKPKFFYGSQVDISPPKFLLFFRNAADLHFSYPRYLENEIRKEYGFNGTSINLRFKSKSTEEKKTK
jgi:GTPase